MDSSLRHLMTAEQIFMVAVEKSPGSERNAFVLQACAGRATLREEVESLLKSHDSAGSFLQQPFVELSLHGSGTEGLSTSPDHSGSQLGRYDILRRIGAGGMGEVYLARDLQLQREVAIKLLTSRQTDNPLWLRRFHREARAASAVNHPNILTIYEIGESNGRHFIATEMIEGMTLRTFLADHSLSLPQVLDTAIQIASALMAAHAATIVHRDLKPENIMVRHDGLIKVLDFGLAKHLDPADEGLPFGGGEPRDDISSPGSVLGTLHYMSPEQARGLAVDTRSDIFSFGVVLFEMLTKEQPFRGATPSDVLVSILNREPPRLFSCDYELPAELVRIVTTALQKERDQRYQNARDLYLDLKQVLQGEKLQGGPLVLVPQTRTRPPAETLRTHKSRQIDDPRQVDELPEVRYTCSGDVNIAYQVFGTGEIDLVFVMGWVSHLEWFWKEPGFAGFLRRLGTFARVILFDKRGTGLSDRVPVDQLPTLEQRMDDLRAVMDAVASQSAVLLGVSEGGPMCALFAATYPEKTIALAMIGSYARRLWADDYPWGVRDSDRQHFLDEIRRSWGGPVGIEDRAPSLASDENFRQWWATYLRMGASPGAALALTRMNAQIDIRPILPMIQVPTLILHRALDRCLKVEEGRFLAEQIPGARFVELPGHDHLPFVGDQETMLDHIEAFVGGVRSASGDYRVLATVLVARLVHGNSGQRAVQDPPELKNRFEARAIREVELFRGTNFAYFGDSFHAIFDGPTRAIRAAIAITDSAARHGLRLQTGLHIGECDIVGNTIGGAAVKFAEQICSFAAAEEILVSNPVKDLVAGSGISFLEHIPIDRSTSTDQLKLFRVVH